MFRRRHRPIHYRPRPRFIPWLVSIVVVGLGVGAALHYGSEGLGVASSPQPPPRVPTFTGRGEAGGPIALRIEAASFVLYGVDPPGAGIDCDGGDCATLARAAMTALVGEREIHCVGRPQADGRAAATCFLPDGTDVAAALVARGWALAASDAPLYRGEEERARAAGLGIWARPSEAQVTAPPQAAPQAPPQMPAAEASPQGSDAPPVPRPPNTPSPAAIGPGGYIPPED